MLRRIGAGRLMKVQSQPFPEGRDVNSTHLGQSTSRSIQLDGKDLMQPLDQAKYDWLRR